MVLTADLGLNLYLFRAFTENILPLLRVISVLCCVYLAEVLVVLIRLCFIYY